MNGPLIRFCTPLAIAVSLLLTCGDVANADHPDYSGLPCGEELNAVGDAIDAGNFLGNNADRDKAKLLAKLQAAADKIDAGKFDDAIRKLENISSKATALANAPKPKLEDASGITIAVDAAIVCIEGL